MENSQIEYLKKAKSGLENAIGAIDGIPYDQPPMVEKRISEAYNKLDKAYRTVIAELNK